MTKKKLQALRRIVNNKTVTVKLNLTGSPGLRFRGLPLGVTHYTHPKQIGALAHLGLGRSYTLAGDLTKARIAYQDFFALWKDADPDVPILKDAKAEYEKLT